jgi:hypothetical protein
MDCWGTRVERRPARTSGSHRSGAGASSVPVCIELDHAGGAAAFRPEAAATTVSARTPVARTRRGSGGRLPRRSLVVRCGSDSAPANASTLVSRPERSSRGWSTRHSLACGCERVRGRPAYSCQGLSPGLGRRGASGAGFSARQARRRKLGTEPTDRPTSCERGNHQSPLRNPAAAASRTAATAHDRVSHPTRAGSASWRTSHPRKSSPRSQPGSSCGPRPARAGRSGDAARRPASDPGRLKAPTHDLDYLVAPAAQQGL